MPHPHKSWVKPIVFLCLLLFVPFSFENKPAPSQTKASFTQVPVPIDIETPNPLTQALAEDNVPPRPQGFSLTISAINLSIPLGKTHLDSAGRLAVPANANTAAWYESGPRIGEKGTALITGHLESNSFKPGVFYNLKNLTAGDRIEVGRPDGSVAVYQVAKLESYSQDNTFPWSKVYSESGPSSLRIITCDGYYSKSLGRYTKNLVVYASLVSFEKPAN